MIFSKSYCTPSLTTQSAGRYLNTQNHTCIKACISKMYDMAICYGKNHHVNITNSFCIQQDLILRVIVCFVLHKIAQKQSLAQQLWVNVGILFNIVPMMAPLVCIQQPPGRTCILSNAMSPENSSARIPRNPI